MNDLSPAAEKVLDATMNVADTAHDAKAVAAAAIEAVADQVVPRRRKPMYADSSEESAWSAQQDTRDELLAIAAELKR